jgi:hypothetical protein
MEKETSDVIVVNDILYDIIEENASVSLMSVSSCDSMVMSQREIVQAIQRLNHLYAVRHFKKDMMLATIKQTIVTQKSQKEKLNGKMFISLGIEPRDISAAKESFSRFLLQISSNKGSPEDFFTDSNPNQDGRLMKEMCQLELLAILDSETVESVQTKLLEWFETRWTSES